MPTIIDYDWLDTRRGNRLHHATIDGLPSDSEDIVDALWSGLDVNVRLDCGRTVRRVWIPGMFSRMSVPRCKRCCTANGLPEGIGSPKNDPECRRILGLDTA